MSIKSVLFGVLTLVLGFILVPATFAQSDMAMVRVVHASPDAPAVDVYVDGNEVLSDVPFFTASDYLELAPGEYRFQVTPAGEPAESAVIDARATVEAGQAYTVAATGMVEDIAASIIVDDLSAPARGQVKVRVYHFSPDAPAVDVKLADGTALIESLAFPDASDYLAVDAGTYDLQVTPAGADDVVLDLAGTTLEAGNIYSVFATNEVASLTPELQVYTPAGEAAQAATATPAPAATSAPAGSAPGTLPETADGSATPWVWLMTAALVLIGSGALIVRRRGMR